MKLHALSAKDIKAFSVCPSESELVLPLNTCLLIERVVTSQDLTSLSGLLDDLPENVDLIVARQQRVSEDAITSAIAKDAHDLSLFQSQRFTTSVLQAPTASHDVPVAAAVAPSPASTAALPASPPISLSSSMSSSQQPSPSQPLSSVTPAKAIETLQSATDAAAAASFAYYQDVAFAAKLCDDLGTAHRANESLSKALEDACLTLSGIMATKPPCVPSISAVSSAVSDADAILNADPGLKRARRRMADADETHVAKLNQKLQECVSQTESDQIESSRKLQAAEDNIRAMAAAEIRLREQQLGVYAGQIDHMKARELRALAAHDYELAQETNAGIKAYTAECNQRVEAAAAERNLQLQRQVKELRAAARESATADQNVVADKQSRYKAELSALRAAADQRLKDHDAMTASLLLLVSRARELLRREPAWPRHEVLLHFELPLQRWTTNYVFSKKWFPRNFLLRGSRLYYSDGENRHPDTAQGTLAFMLSNPAPDGRYCVDLQGTRALSAHLFCPFVTLLLRLQRGRLQRGGRRAGVRLRDQVPCRAEGACVVSQLVRAHHAECCRVRRTCASLLPTTSRVSAACALSKLRAQAPPHCRTSRWRWLSRQAWGT